MSSNPHTGCDDPQRRRDVRARGHNGIDYVEVNDDGRTIVVYLLGRAPQNLVMGNVRITGGARIRDLQVVDIRLHSADDEENDDRIEITLDRRGDLSTYTLSVVELDERGEPTDRPLAGFDPRYALAPFTFDTGTHNEFDCKPAPVRTDRELPVPEINYLAKDYASFRQLILDRLAVSMPGWREQHVPDLGIALVEILAYVGDYLSYFQDAVATEAYLDTARQRVSVRRHVRLVDYAMHEGCNARAWLCIAPADDVALKPGEVYFAAGLGAAASGPGLVLPPADLAGKSRRPVDLFEPVASTPTALYAAHAEILFYTWGQRRCWLPVGATSATLLDEAEAEERAEAPVHRPEPHGPPKRAAKAATARQTDVQTSPPPPAPPEAPPRPSRRLHLQVGDILLFEEIKGPESGLPADADPRRRHIVQLTSVKPGHDPLYDKQVVEIEWAAEDALPFALCLSSIGQAPRCAHLPNVTVARGNIVLADHGIWTGTGSRIEDEQLGIVPRAPLVQTCEGVNRPAQVQVRAEAFRPRLAHAPLTFRQPISTMTAAAGALIQDPRLAVPQVELRSIPPKLDGSGPLFRFSDLKDPDLKDPLGFASRLLDSKDPADQALRGRLSRQTRDSLEKSRTPGNDEKALAAGLRQDLEPLVRIWAPQRDLLASHGADLHFVVEMDNDGYAHLRFGDGVLGRAPQAGEMFEASYRIGIGGSGNVGAETITAVVASPKGSPGLALRCRNPLAAGGGTDPEPIAQVKLIAPTASRNDLQRAIKAEDYATLAAHNPKVQRAAAALQWTGTRYEARVAIDPFGTERVDTRLLRQIRAYLRRYQRVGHDVIVVPPQYIPLDLAMTVEIRPGYPRDPVAEALRDAFSNRVLAGGTRGFFHPDNLSFGDPIRVSRLVGTAQAVSGVASIVVTRLERLFAGADHELENGFLPIGPLEVARLDNDPVFPENGRFVLTLRGGL